MPHYLISREPIPAGASTVLCQDTWMGGCGKTATWRMGCGPDVRFFCDSHEGSPCGGVFLGDFVITPDTTREDLMSVVNCGAHRIHSQSGRDVHGLWCCACGEWIGDSQYTEIGQVSISLDAECHPDRSREARELRCRACDKLLTVTPSGTPHETLQPC